MAEEIGKLAVSLSMDDDGFNNSISGINRSLKVLGSELGALRSQGSEFGNSVEGLAQRQDALGRTLTVQEQKVNQLRAAYERSAAETGQYSTKSQQLATQLNKAVGEMNRTKTELNQVGTALSQQKADAAKAESAWTKFSNAMDKASQKLQDAGQKMKDIGGNMSAGVTAPLLGLGAGALKTASDVDASQGRIQAQLGVTADEAEELKGVANDVWKNAFGESLEEVTDNLSIVRQNLGDLNNADLQKVLEGAYTLKDAFGAEINESTRTASVLMKNFGVDSETAFDLMTTGFQRGGNFSDELLDTMREYSPQFKAMGYTAEEFTAILIAGAEAGAFNLDKIGDAAKENFLRIGDGSKTSRDALEGLGLDFNQIEKDIAAGGDTANSAFTAVSAALAGVESDSERSQAAIALFGAPLEDLGPEFQNFFANVNTDLGDFEGATQEASNAMYDNFGSRLTTVFRELQTALLPLGEVLLGWAETVLPKITSAAQKMAEWFGKMSPAGQTLTVVFGAIAAALGPLFVVLGMVIGAIGNMLPVITKILPYLKNLKTVFTVIRTVMLALTGPIGLTIAIISALAIAIYQNWDTIKAKTIEVWNYLKVAIPQAWEAIKAKTSEILTAIGAFIKSVWEGIKAYFMFVLSVYKSIFTAAWNGIKTAITTVMNAIRTTVTTIWNGIKTSIQTVMNTIKAVITAIWNGIKAYYTALFSALRTIVTTGFNAMRTAISTVLNAIKSVIMTIWNGIKAYYTTLFRALRTIATTGFNAIRTAITTVMNAIRSVITSVWNGIKSVITRTVNGIKSTAVSVFNSMKSGISTAVNSIKSTVSRVFNSVKSAITNPIQSAKSTVLGIIDTIKGAFSRMSIKIPKPKLPKVSVTMGSKSVGGIDIPFPKFDVSWFAKGGIIDGASVVGVGEAGPEAIVPLQGANMRPFAEAIAAAMPNGGVGGGLVTVEVPIYLDGYQIAKASQPYIDLNQQSKTQQKSYMKGVK